MKLVEAEVIRGDWIDPRLGKKTLASCAEEWWASTVEDMEIRCTIRDGGSDWLANQLS